MALHQIGETISLFHPCGHLRKAGFIVEKLQPFQQFHTQVFAIKWQSRLGVMITKNVIKAFIVHTLSYNV